MGLRTAAAALVTAAVLHTAGAAGHEAHRHRSPVPARAGMAAADEAQSRHDFAAARAELDRLLATDPRDLEARLMRANLSLLAGEFSQARGDCRAALESGHLYAGTVCTA
jgi:Tfp pilus assembly protein PilF